jgi:Virulence-associated protein E
MSLDEIAEEIAKWPNGIGQRYAGRLRQEVERSFEKWETKRRIRPDKGTTEPDEENKWDSVNKKGIPNPTRTNARRALRSLGIKCRYDEFHDRLLVESNVFKQLINLDHTALMLCAKIHKAYKFDPGPRHVLDGIIQLCLENRFDPVADYLNALVWDGAPRLDRWLIDYLGSEDTELNREFGRLALIAAVRRVRRPGTKFDPIIVLEGPMGTQKSKAIETMAGTENFSDQTILGARDREQQELLAGVWLFEIAELSNIRKTEVEHIKAFASRTHDRARPAYGRTRVDQPRRCVLFATTNDDQYLKIADRRFWPVKTTTIDIGALERDRDQLWAEAAQQEAEGASIVLDRSLWGPAYVEQTAREEHDPWDDILSGVIGTVEQGEERVFSRDLLKTVLEFQTSRLLDRDSKRLSRCMRRLGWDGPKVVRIGQERTSGYTRVRAT